MRNSIPAAAWAWLVLVGVASFLNWATFRSSLSTFADFGGLPNAPFDGVVIAANAWTSNLWAFKNSFPNWLPVVAALASVGTVYARNNGADLAPKLPKILLIYAFVHAALFAFIIWSGGNSNDSLGIGPFVMLLALGGLWKTPDKNSIKTPII